MQRHAGSEKLFDKWLKKTAIDSARQVRMLLEKEGDEDPLGLDDDEDDEDGMGAGDSPSEVADDEAGGEQSIADVMDNDAGSGSGEGEGRGGPQIAKAAYRDVPAPSAEELSVRNVIAKLNAIRSGKSFKDADVIARMGEYFEDLNLPQRLALFAFLEGLAEVIATDVAGKAARAPSDPDINVDMTQEQGEQEVDKDMSQARVAKPAEEYGNQQQQQKQSAQAQPVQKQTQTRTAQKTRTAAAPQRVADADEDTPVMIAKR